MKNPATLAHIHSLTLQIILSFTAAMLLTGCKAAHEPGGVSHAVVQISGHTLDEIQKTTAEVFGDEGYTLAQQSQTLMVFQRDGSRRDAAKYGGWSGEGITMRVRVEFTELAGSNFKLRADVSAVEDADDPFFADESRAMMLNRRPYQQLLDQVDKRLE